MMLLAGLWARVQGWMVALAAGVAILASAYLAGRRGAQAGAAVDNLEAALSRRETRDEVDRGVARDPGAAERLRRDWSRD
jgi:hypothetical protein